MRLINREWQPCLIFVRYVLLISDHYKIVGSNIWKYFKIRELYPEKFLAKKRIALNSIILQWTAHLNVHLVHTTTVRSSVENGPPETNLPTEDSYWRLKST